MKHRSELQAGAIARWAERWDLRELPDRVQVSFSKRLRRSLGRCCPDTGEIRLNPALLDGPTDLLQEVLCHEVAHVATYLKYGRSARPHGPEWRHLVSDAGFTPRARMPQEEIPVSLRAAFRRRLFYEHRCTACGASRIAKRVVRQWRCRSCRDAGFEGLLEINRCPQ